MKWIARRFSGACRLAMAAVLASAGTVAGAATQEMVEDPEPGGVFRIVSNGLLDSPDPGQTYRVFGFQVHRVTVRTLVSPPSIVGAEGARPVADLATTTGEVSDGGTTYAFRLRERVKYQPGVAGGREVTSADIRYGIERGFLASVASPYAANYFQDVIVGDKEFVAGSAEHIAGIEVGDPKTIVFRLRRPTGDFLDRLTLPLAAPVPEEYAAPLDAKDPSTYGQRFASSGPYMMRNYVQNKGFRLVRNPNWDSSTDPIREAYPDAIEVTAGVTDNGEAFERILDGEFDYSADHLLPPELFRSVRDDPAHQDQLHIDPASCFSYLYLNTTVAPFDQVEVRQAVSLRPLCHPELGR